MEGWEMEGWITAPSPYPPSLPIPHLPIPHLPISHQSIPTSARGDQMRRGNADQRMSAVAGARDGGHPPTALLRST